MGVALSRAVQWDSSGADQLENTHLNKAMLNEILLFTEEFGTRHPQEAKLVFREPLQWKTSLEASDFKTEYDIR